MHTQKQIRYVSSEAETPEDLLWELKRELLSLMASDPKVIDTALIVHPHTLTDFLDFNDFSDSTEGLIKELELDGQVQIATFHPQYQFAGTAPDDIENYTNRSPYPTLQILRESSVEAALSGYGNPDKIFEKNIQALRKLGIAALEVIGARGSSTGNPNAAMTKMSQPFE